MRGVRDLLLVAVVVALTMALGALGTGFSRFEQGSHAADAEIEGGVLPEVVDLEFIDRDPPTALARLERFPSGTWQIPLGPILEPRPTGLPALWSDRPVADGASPEANDLRGFLANIARATHDGNSIGITGEDPDVVWEDDAAK
jgi:hypothetical protein